MTKELHVILDSTVRVSAGFLAENPRIHTVPLKVMVGAEEWREDEITCSEFFERVARTGISPRTSQPSPGDFLTVMQPLATAGHPLLVITMSGQLSGTVRGAQAVARMMTGAAVEVVDSETTGFGMAWMAQQALRLHDRGMNLQDVALQTTRTAQATRTIFVPDTLEYLRRGGRIGAAANMIGNILNIRPVLCLVEGGVQVLDKVRTRQRAISRVVEEIGQTDKLLYIACLQSDDMTDWNPFVQPIRDAFPGVPVYTGEVGPVIAAHTGPRTIGVTYQQYLGIH